MRATELIAKLQELVEDLGFDAEVTVWDQRATPKSTRLVFIYPYCNRQGDRIGEDRIHVAD